VQSKHPAIGEPTTLGIQATCRGETTSQFNVAYKVRHGTDCVGDFFLRRPRTLYRLNV
jgi:hypothetical protein